MLQKCFPEHISDETLDKFARNAPSLASLQIDASKLPLPNIGESADLLNCLSFSRIIGLCPVVQTCQWCQRTWGQSDKSPAESRSLSGGWWCHNLRRRTSTCLAMSFCTCSAKQNSCLHENCTKTNPTHKHTHKAKLQERRCHCLQILILNAGHQRTGRLSQRTKTHQWNGMRTRLWSTKTLAKALRAVMPSEAWFAPHACWASRRSMALMALGKDWNICQLSADSMTWHWTFWPGRRSLPWSSQKLIRTRCHFSNLALLGKLCKKTALLLGRHANDRAVSLELVGEKASSSSCPNMTGTVCQFAFKRHCKVSSWQVSGNASPGTVLQGISRRLCFAQCSSWSVHLCREMNATEYCCNPGNYHCCRWFCFLTNAITVDYWCWQPRNPASPFTRTNPLISVKSHRSIATLIRLACTQPALVNDGLHGCCQQQEVLHSFSCAWVSQDA